MGAPVSAGHVIVLNGVSSSGKSSIAAELLAVLERPYFHMPVDVFGGLRSRERTRELDEAGLAEVLARTRAGFHRAVAGMARAGNDLVVDYVLSEPWRLTDLLEVLDGVPVTLAGVHCSRAELERRERARGDRLPGLAAAQARVVNAHGLYDIECDTTLATPRECAIAISRFLPRQPRPGAFDILRTRLADRPGTTGSTTP